MGSLEYNANAHIFLKERCFSYISTTYTLLRTNAICVDLLFAHVLVLCREMRKLKVHKRGKKILCFLNI